MDAQFYGLSNSTPQASPFPKKVQQPRSWTNLANQPSYSTRFDYLKNKVHAQFQHFLPLTPQNHNIHSLHLGPPPVFKSQHSFSSHMSRDLHAPAQAPAPAPAPIVLSHHLNGIKHSFRSFLLLLFIMSCLP